MGTQKKLDLPDDFPKLIHTGYEKHETRRAAALALICQRLNFSIDDVLAKVRHMTIMENVDERTAIRRYSECAEERRDPYPNVCARNRR